MKLAIMQPYFFPYIGYFQLLKAVDKFVIFDDVNFIKKGWINRNRILLDNKAHPFTLPVEKASQNKRINELLIADDGKWKNKLLKTIRAAYIKTPMFNMVFPIIENMIRHENPKLSEYLYYSILKLCEYLNINTQIIDSSAKYNTAHLKGQEKIIDICLKEKATHYFNLIGGVDLYNTNDFAKHNIQLFFLKSNNVIYDQCHSGFVSNLSIIDIMMFNSVENIQIMLEQFAVITHD